MFKDCKFSSICPSENIKNHCEIKIENKSPQKNIHSTNEIFEKAKATDKNHRQYLIENTLAEKTNNLVILLNHSKIIEPQMCKALERFEKIYYDEIDPN